MNFLEAFDELSILTEESNGGQYTYKQFLIALAKFLDIQMPQDYLSWDLHHRDGQHKNNGEFSNIVFIEPGDHRSLHASVRAKKYGGKDSATYQKALKDKLKDPEAHKGRPYNYFPIGEFIDQRLKFLNAKQTEPDVEKLETRDIAS